MKPRHARERSSRRMVMIGLAAALVVAVGGCGSSGSTSSEESTGPDDVVNQYVEAVVAGDGSKACSLLTSEEQDKTGSVAGSCEQAIEGFAQTFTVQREKVHVGQPKIDGDSATVALSAGAQS